MPWIGAAIAGGVGLIGDLMSSHGQQQTNAMQMEIAQKEMDWQTQMSNTAMQRRVADLKAAGLNPMLAAGGPGAMMGSPVMPNLQNPSAAFGQLGNQATSAAQLQTQNAQIEQMKATANKMNVEAGTEVPAQVAKLQSETGLNQTRASEVQRQIAQLDIVLQPYGGKSMYQETQENLNAQQAIKTHIMQMDQQTQSDTLATLIKARNDANFAAAIGARNIASANDTAFGRIMAYFHLGQPAVSTAVGAARTLGEFVP